MGLISRAWTNLAPPGAISLKLVGVSRPNAKNSRPIIWPSIKLASIRIWLRVNEPAP
jgi:hypothetical protein